MAKHIPDTYDEYNKETALTDNFEEENDLEEAEAQAILDEEFSEPEGLTGPQADAGYVDEAIIGAELTEEGAGANFYPSDVEDLGLHVESPAYSIETYDEEPQDENQ